MENDLKKTFDYKIRIDVYENNPKTDGDFYMSFIFDYIDTKMTNFIKICFEQGKYISIYKG